MALAFAELGQASTAHSLALGVLFGWLPILVILSHPGPEPGVVGSIVVSSSLHCLRPSPAGSCLHVFGVEAQNFDRFQTFIGQGRQLGYCGLAEAVTSHWRTELGTARDDNGEVAARKKETNLTRLTSRSLVAIGEAAAAAVTDCSARRPLAWWFIWLFSWLLVGWQVGFAYMISHNTPSIGFGCRSGLLRRLLWPEQPDLASSATPGVSESVRQSKARLPCSQHGLSVVPGLYYLCPGKVHRHITKSYVAQKPHRLPVAAAY